MGTATSSLSESLNAATSSPFPTSSLDVLPSPLLVASTCMGSAHARAVVAWSWPGSTRARCSTAARAAAVASGAVVAAAVAVRGATALGADPTATESGSMPPALPGGARTSWT
ncbi:hypothetical protein Pcac1_g28341 [Phytophthora cactorum]|nr:hypothetical protein Pcac1_g28341 [Phytophthora cactorum]